MRHRHLKTERWTLAAIDSTLERGNLEDWRALFAEARKDAKIAEAVLKVAAKPAPDASAKLARALVGRIYPEFAE